MNKTTKKLLGLATAAALCLSQISAFAADPSNDKVVFNGNEINNISLIIDNDRNLMPLRAISELLGASVYWINDTQTIQVVAKDRVCQYQIDNNNFNVFKLENGKAELLQNVTLPNDVNARLEGDRTYIPLRASIVALLVENPADITTEKIAKEEKTENSRGDSFDYDWENGKIIINVSDLKQDDYSSISDVRTNEKYHNETYRIKGKMTWNADTESWKIIGNPDNPDDYVFLKNPNEGILNEQFRVSGADSTNQDKVFDPNGLDVVLTGFTYANENDGENHLEIKRTTASLRPVTADLSIDGDKDKFSYSVESIKGDDKSVSSEKLPVGATVDIKANEGTDTNKFKVYYNGNALNFENGAAKITVAEGENKLEIKEESVNVELPECFELLPETDVTKLKVGDNSENNKIKFKVKDGYIVNTTDGTKLSVKVNDTATDAEVVQDFITETKPTGKKDDNGNEITEEIKTPNGQHYEIPVTSENMKVTVDWIKVDEDSKVAADVIAYVNNHVRFTYPNDISTISLNGKADSLKKEGNYIISVDAVASGTTVSITAPTAAPEKTDEPTADNTETKTEDNTEVKTDETAATPEK